MGMWAIIVNCLFPIPLAILLLLSIPLPNFMKDKTRNILLYIIDSLLFVKLYGNFSIYSIATSLSLILFLINLSETASGNYKEKNAESIASASIFRCNRWRAERNFWISVLSLSLWLILYKVRALTNELAAIKNKEPRRQHQD